MPRRETAAGNMLQGEESSSFSDQDVNNSRARQSKKNSSRLSQGTPQRTSSRTPRSAHQRSPQGRRQETSDSRATPSTSRGNARREPPPPRIQPPRNKRRKALAPMKDPYKAIKREIRYYQKTTGLLIPRAPFSRTVRECLQSHGDFRLTTVAFDAIQEAAEIYLTQLLEDAYRCTIFRRCVTLHPKDIHLVRYLRGFSDPTS